MYDHEQRERREPREIQHVVMPPRDLRQSALMYCYLSDRDLDYELAVANGWYPTVAKGPRVVIPCINSAKFNYWQARTLLDHPLRYDSPPIPRKDSIVFLWPRSGQITTGDAVVITEGPMDALAAAELYPAIALMGGMPSQEVMNFVACFTSGLGLVRWILVPDNDNTALVESLLAYEGLQVIIPAGKDLAGMPAWERKKLLGGI